MKNTEKFEKFLENLKTEEHALLIESIKEGFKTIMEGYSSLEDAMEAEVTKAEAKREIQKHSLKWEDFVEEVGDREEYTGREVLEWLGY